MNQVVKIQRFCRDCGYPFSVLGIERCCNTDYDAAEVAAVSEQDGGRVKLVNLTPHALNVLAGGESYAIPPSGEVARVKTERREAGTIAGIPLFETTFGDVTGLPSVACEGTYYIVSLIVKSHPACRDRADLLCPGELVRDAAGDVTGCKGLSK